MANSKRFKSTLSMLTLSTICNALPQSTSDVHKRSAVAIPETPPDDAGVPLESFITYSIEFSSFIDFAGNTSAPNDFSHNLLNNLANYAGIKPYIRVGGNTQDFAIFNESQDVAQIGIFDDSISTDYPSQITIGPAFFDSYHTWPGVKYVHGFNLGRNSSIARQGLIDSASYACKALGGGKLLHWELGNEPDLFKEAGARPANWTEQDYVDEWLKYTREIRAAMKKACPDMATDSKYTYYAPSFAGTGGNSLDPLTTWEEGLDSDKDIAIISSHNYISGAETPGVTLQGTLMNHTSTVASIALQLNSSTHLSALPQNLNPSLPFILGETNSLYRQGRPGLSNTFGATLWGVDFALYSAANNIRRVHMHQGTNYRYQSWQPIETNKTSKGTKAPYYGNIAVASFLGDIIASPPKVVNMPLPNSAEAAYAAYIDGKLSKLMVINMQAYNATDYNSEYINEYPRPVETYAFRLPQESCETSLPLQRLTANGSDAITGVTFDGYSYNYELDNGKPVLLSNVTRGETAKVNEQGVLTLEVERSSAVIVSLQS